MAFMFSRAALNNHNCSFVHVRQNIIFLSISITSLITSYELWDFGGLKSDEFFSRGNKKDVSLKSIGSLGEHGITHEDLKESNRTNLSF